jgi:predicted ester cyclase
VSEADPAVARALVTRWVNDFFNARNLAVAQEILAPDFVGHTAAQPEPVRGPAEHAAFIGRVHTMSHDLRATLDDLFAAGDRAAFRMTMHGTQTGVYRVSDFLQGIPATGRPFQFSVTVIARVSDGRIAEMWQELDALGFMQQLGVVPPPGVGPVGLLAWAVSTVVRLGRLSLQSAPRRTVP